MSLDIKHVLCASNGTTDNVNFIDPYGDFVDNE